ncbi:MAG TPA: FliH/SctL family protein [Solirubrobacteraceae bacterium]|jgi:flagellar biosynthesis/type III secretory pathway protein FliH
MPTPSPSVAPFEFAPLEPASAEAAAAAGPAPLAPPQVDLDAIRAEGFNEGYTAGAADARSVVEPAAEALRAAASELAALRAGVAERSERAAVELALRIAEQVLQGALAVEPERVVEAVRGALRRLVERDRVLVLVHPDDLDVVREQADALVAELGGIEHCGIEADRRVSRGGAIVRTAEGEVDATLETKLGRAREVVEQELAR